MVRSEERIHALAGRPPKRMDAKKRKEGRKSPTRSFYNGVLFPHAALSVDQKRVPNGG